MSAPVWGEHGIVDDEFCIAVTPGPTATKPLLEYMEAQPGGVAKHVQGLDLQRLSLPDEVANTVLWLASEESSNITGICVRSNIRAESARPVAE